MESTRTRNFLLLILVAFVAAVLLATLLNRPQTVRGKSTAQPLSAELTADETRAQDLALFDERVHAYTTGNRTEVFGVHHIADNHYPATSAVCDTADCRRVEIYDFDDNAAITAIVDLDSETVIDVLYLPEMHPGINKRLNDLALDIALNEPEIIDILGFTPEKADMAPVESTLIGTLCDDGHLCAGPTFELADRGEVLWAIVDLTTEEFVGTYFTDYYVTAPSPDMANPPEVQDCGAAINIARDGWSMDYVTTGSDGLMVTDATFNGQMVLKQAKVAEWHADYGNSGYVDATGCTGGGGFPIFPFGDTQVVDIEENGAVVGFELVQDFRMSNWGAFCNYRYEQHYEFYNDGRFRVVSGAYGKGCGSDALYRPLTRIDIAVDGDSNDNFAMWNGSSWDTWALEGYNLQDDASRYTPEGYMYRVMDSNGAGYYVEPGVGQFPDSRGDNAHFYLTQHNPAEGDTDLGAVGNCCFDDDRQGPHNFLNDEPTVNENLVLWYVPQMQTTTDAGNEFCWTELPSTWPCFEGPMFHPISDDPGVLPPDTIHVTGNDAAQVAGMSLEAADILTYNAATDAWAMLFDASDVGLSGANLSAFLRFNEVIAMSFDSITNVPGLGIVDAADIVLFRIDSLGGNTAGTFSWLMDGSDVGLTNSDAGVDAMAVSPNGKLLVSTGGPVLYNGSDIAQDEDILEFTQSAWGTITEGTWELYFDGSDVGLGDDDDKDIRGVWVDGLTGTVYFSIKETTDLAGVAVERNDIVSCGAVSLGSDTSCGGTQAVFWEGSAEGMGGFYLDGIDMGRSAGKLPTLQAIR